MTKEQQIPAAVLRRDDEGGPLPQMVAQHREQLRQEREATPSSNPLASPGELLACLSSVTNAKLSERGRQSVLVYLGRYVELMSRLGLASDAPLPDETSGPFERTAILADPNTMRIKIAFQEREDYEAALVFFQMGDSPKEPRETTENPNNAPARDLLIVSTGPWNENRFTVCRGTTEVEDDIIADFVHRADAELFVAAKRSAEEPTELPEALRDPVKNLERGRELLKAWGPTPVTDAALAESKESPLARAVRIARGDTGPPTEPVRFAEKASASHVHVWEKRGDFGGASCKCGTRADGWYCPDSPDHLCHYEKGNFDQCDFCGLPEERK